MGNDVFDFLQRPIIQYLRKIGVLESSLIQKLSIPKILDGKHILIIAPTGMGKTLAAVLPVVNMFLSLKSTREIRGISILYITPLRALNRDIYRRIAELGEILDVRVEVRHGDTSHSVRAMQAKFPPDMLITTPETLQAILPGKRMRQHLKSVRWVIIDEVHELSTDKRGCQLAVALERLFHLTARDYQRIGLSATIGDTYSIGQFLAGVDRKINIVKSSEVKKYDISVEYIHPNKDDIKAANQLALPPSYVSKVRKIIHLVSNHQSTLIFTNTREQAEALGSLIYALDRNLKVKVHHGSLSKEIREETEKKIHDGQIKGIICTSSLELGIDVGHIDLVIQYMSPRQATKLIQRIGRSGHAIEATPKGILIGGIVDDLLESLVLISRSERDDLEHVEIHLNAYDVLSHQIIGVLLDFRDISVKKIFEIVKGAYPFKDLKIENFLNTLDQLERLGLVRKVNGNFKIKTTRVFRYYYQNLSMIPDVKKYTVFDFFRKKRIGTLDQEFVAKRCKSGTNIILHGNTWKVITTDEGNFSVEVEPTIPTLDAIPSWEGEIIPVEHQTAIEVGRLRKELVDKIDEGCDIKKLAGKFKVSVDALMKVAGTLKDHALNYPLPHDRRIVLEKFENIVILHSCFGNLVNESLGLTLTSILCSKYGMVFRYLVDPYRVALISPFGIDQYTIKRILEELKSDEINEVIDTAVESSDLFIWRHWHIAKRCGVVDKETEYNFSRAKMLVTVFKDSILNEEAKRELYTEKMDLSKTKNILEKISTGEIEISISRNRGDKYSPLSHPILDKLIPHYMLRPITSTKPMFHFIRERILRTTARFVCMFKGDWEGIRLIDQIPEKIICKKCGSSLVAVTYSGDTQLMKLVNKRRRGTRLSKKEYYEWFRGWKSASLVQIYGKKAIVVLSGRGIGPSVATRILKKPYKNEEEFYTNILKAERQYIRTRSFWD